MAVTAANVIMGPGTIYIAAFGATEPADTAVASAPASATWTDLGGTDDGVTVTWGKEYANMSVDQLAMDVGARLTEEVLEVEVNLAEVTLQNLKWAMNNQGTIASSGSVWQSYDPAGETPADLPNYVAIIVDGPAPASTASRNRRLIARKCLNTEAVKAPYKKGDQMIFPVKFKGYYVSASTKAFHLVEQP